MFSFQFMGSPPVDQRGEAGGLFPFAAAGGVPVIAIQSGGTVAPKVEIRLSDGLGMIQQFALEMTATFAVAGLFHVALEFPIASFVLFHVG
jgi:hypothetical protein